MIGREKEIIKDPFGRPIYYTYDLSDAICRCESCPAYIKSKGQGCYAPQNHFIMKPNSFITRKGKASMKDVKKMSYNELKKRCTEHYSEKKCKIV